MIKVEKVREVILRETCLAIDRLCDTYGYSRKSMWEFVSGLQCKENIKDSRWLQRFASKGLSLLAVSEIYKAYLIDIEVNSYAV